MIKLIHAAQILPKSPLEQHVEQAVEAVKKGKNVIVEKPVGFNSQEISRLGWAAQKNKCICVSLINYIYNPEVRRIKRLIEAGDLGKICAAWINFIIHHPEEIAAHYPGVLRQVVTHHFYTLLYLLGKPKRLYASETRLIYHK